MSNKKYENVSIMELENSEIEISGAVSSEAFSEYIKNVLTSTKEEMELPGFRKGKAPESVVEEKVGEEKILNDAAQSALSEVYPQILKENKIDAIGVPQVSITKMAKDNPLEFKIKTAVSPKVELSDYKKAGEEVLSEEDGEENPEVTEEELNEVIKNIKTARKSENKKDETQEENSNKNKTEDNSEEEEKPEDLELTDDFVKELGNFENVEDFKNKIKENIKQEKIHRKKEERRIKILEKIIEDSKIEIPEILIKSELDKMINVYKDDIENKFGYNFEDYLKQIQKTEEELRESLKTEAEKRAKIQVILNNIAEKENISIPEEEIEKNLEAIMKQYPDADKNSARIYVDSVLTNEKVYQLLESK